MPGQTIEDVCEAEARFVEEVVKRHPNTDGKPCLIGNCQAGCVKNLFIVDGSIWVTSGGVNPTSTIQALALYIADSIKKRLATLLD
jgi:Protein of unknown function (DUF3141)/GMC oxidoreductase